MCEDTSAIWEGGSEFMKKLELRKFRRKSRFKILNGFLLFIISFMSSSSFSATQQTLTKVHNSFSLRVLKRQRIFAFSAERWAACFFSIFSWTAHSFRITLSSDFNWLWAWFRDSNNIRMQDWSQWVHLEHFSESVMMMQVVWDKKQWLQTEEEVKLYVAMNFASCKWFFCLEDSMMMKKLKWDTLSLMKSRGLVFRRERIVLWSYSVVIM